MFRKGPHRRRQHRRRRWTPFVWAALRGRDRPPGRGTKRRRRLALRWHDDRSRRRLCWRRERRRTARRWRLGRLCWRRERSRTARRECLGESARSSPRIETERRRTARRWRLVLEEDRWRRPRQNERPTLAFALPSLRAARPRPGLRNCRARACRPGSPFVLGIARRRTDLRKKELVYARLSSLSTFDADDSRAWGHTFSTRLTIFVFATCHTDLCLGLTHRLRVNYSFFGDDEAVHLQVKRKGVPRMARRAHDAQQQLLPVPRLQLSRPLGGFVEHGGRPRSSGRGWGRMSDRGRATEAVADTLGPKLLRITYVYVCALTGVSRLSGDAVFFDMPRQTPSNTHTPVYTHTPLHTPVYVHTRILTPTHPHTHMVWNEIIPPGRPWQSRKQIHRKSPRKQNTGADKLTRMLSRSTEPEHCLESEPNDSNSHNACYRLSCNRS